MQRPRFNELFCQLSLSSGYTIFRTTKWQICSLDSGNKALSWAPVCHTGLQGLLLDVVSLLLHPLTLDSIHVYGTPTYNVLADALDKVDGQKDPADYIRKYIIHI